MIIGAEKAEITPNSTGSFYHYIYDGNDWQLNQQFLPQIPEDENSIRFGSLSVQSDNWLVTSSEADTYIGSIIFYKKENGNWVRHSKIDSRVRDDLFGWNIAIDGNTVIASAMWETNQVGQRTGAAYVYEYLSLIHI